VNATIFVWAQSPQDVGFMALFERAPGPRFVLPLLRDKGGREEIEKPLHRLLIVIYSGGLIWICGGISFGVSKIYLYTRCRDSGSHTRILLGP
jgi:hypothetical protein